MQRLAGSGSRVWEERRSSIAAAMSSGRPMRPQRMRRSTKRPTAWARGAAAAALKELYGAPWSTTGPARPRNPATDTEREADMKAVGVGVIGCGVISGAYLKAAQEFSDPRYPRARRRGSGGGRGAGEGVRAEGGQRRRAARRSDDRDRAEPDRAEGACRGRAEGDRRRQACLFGEAARRALQGRQAAGRARRGRRGFASAPRPTRFSAARTRPAAS